MLSATDEMATKERGAVYIIITASVLIFFMLTSGCGFFGVISEKGAKASDELLRDSIWAMCNATPVGAVKRKFNTPDLVSAYDTICSSQDKLPVNTDL